MYKFGIDFESRANKDGSDEGNEEEETKSLLNFF